MARLKVSRNDADNILNRHFNEGEALRREAATEEKVLIIEEEPYREWRQGRRRWIQRTEAALGYVYVDKASSEEFARAADPPAYVGGFAAWPQAFETEYLDVENGMNVLKSLTERLVYDEEPEGRGSSAAPLVGAVDPPPNLKKVIFLVHGRDHATRDMVTLFLQNAGPPGEKPVILEELANKGRTLIEKLEQHAGGSQFAVVLLTGDDIGGTPGSMLEELNPRARQNVLLELGWFCGLLGRENVAVLYEPEVEKPSDIDGLAYISLGGDWRRVLARELVSAGYDFSLDRLDS